MQEVEVISFESHQEGRILTKIEIFVLVKFHNRESVNIYMYIYIYFFFFYKFSLKKKKKGRNSTKASTPHCLHFSAL